jgi:hypothetical protein
VEKPPDLMLHPPSPTLPPKPKWRRVMWLEFWLCFLPPVGLWMLWRDRTFDRSAKLRIITYTLLVPVVLYLAASLYLFDATEKAIRAAGGGY